MRTKSLRCPVCGFDGEDLVFAFYCLNPECQNFKDEKNNEMGDNLDLFDEFPYHGHNYCPYED